MSYEVRRPQGSAGPGKLTAEARCELLLDLSRRVRGTLDVGETLHRLLDSVRSIVEFDAAGALVAAGRSRGATGLAEEIVRETREFTGAKGFEDDVPLVLVTRLERRTDARVVVQLPPGKGKRLNFRAVL
jgi:hypothetical protein